MKCYPAFFFCSTWNILPFLSSFSQKICFLPEIVPCGTFSQPNSYKYVCIPFHKYSLIYNVVPFPIPNCAFVPQHSYLYKTLFAALLPLLAFVPFCDSKKYFFYYFPGNMNDFPSTSFRNVPRGTFSGTFGCKSFSFLCSIWFKSIFSRLIRIFSSALTCFPAHNLCFFPCESAFAEFFLFPLAVLPYFRSIVNKYAQNRYEPLFHAFTITFLFFPAKDRFGREFSFSAAFTVIFLFIMKQFLPSYCYMIAFLRQKATFPLRKVQNVPRGTFSIHKKPSPYREWAFCVLRVDTYDYFYPARQGANQI